MCQYVECLLFFFCHLSNVGACICHIAWMVKWSEPHQRRWEENEFKFHSVTCYTNSIVSRIHVNITKRRNITCILVATGVILQNLECIMYVKVGTKLPPLSTQATCQAPHYWTSLNAVIKLLGCGFFLLATEEHTCFLFTCQFRFTCKSYILPMIYWRVLSVYTSHDTIFINPNSQWEPLLARKPSIALTFRHACDKIIEDQGAAIFLMNSLIQWKYAMSNSRWVTQHSLDP